MIRIRRLDSTAPGFDARLEELAGAGRIIDEEAMRIAGEILAAIRSRGDAALLEFTNRLDRRTAVLAELEIPTRRIRAAAAELPQSLRSALEEAANRIREYHERQRSESWSMEDRDGNRMGQRVTPLDRVGVYVPGGRAAYPSTVLMNVIPARVAGVGEITVTVPAPDGIVNPAVLAAADLAGVDRVFSIGGAQAVGALAYGTGLVPAVDKIVGPGNRIVAAAKRLVFGVVGIDMIAGPSEVVVASDASTPAEWIALDLLAQAEHDEDARAILLCTDEDFMASVLERMGALLPQLERADIARASLERNGAFIRMRDREELVSVINRIAPEHLELAVRDPGALMEGVRHAGAIFLGCHAAEVLGDYCAGPNHVLPTARTARFSSPLGVYDFQKRSSFLMCTDTGAAHLAAIAEELARSEGLTAHARAAACRISRG